MASQLKLRPQSEAKVARMMDGVIDLKLTLAKYAREHGGRFVVFGSAARQEMRPDSDVDILVDFPSDLEMEAIAFAEDAGRRLGLTPDIVPQNWAGARLRSRLQREGLFLPGDEQRWTEVMSMADRMDDIFDAAQSAANHFRAATRMFERGGFSDDGDQGYGRSMAFLHAMQSGHTALEDALVRLMKALGEAPPTGSDWHQRVIERSAKASGSQPALLSSTLAAAANVTRAFRHFAARGYLVEFNPEKARPAVQAAEVIAAEFVDELRRLVDDLGLSRME